MRHSLFLFMRGSLYLSRGTKTKLSSYVQELYYMHYRGMKCKFVMEKERIRFIVNLLINFIHNKE